MAKKGAKKRSDARMSGDGGSNTAAPKYPYTNTPKALRTFLKQIPDKPKPTKVNAPLLKSWGHGDTNATSIIRVLKSVGLVNPNNEPSADYATFMDPIAGPPMLGRKIRAIYRELFEAATEPHKESDEALKRLFNIHSGGAPATLQFQIQTFKALCEYATFDRTTGVTGAAIIAGAGARMEGLDQPGTTVRLDRTPDQPTIHIDLHIHLPPDKASRDYQAMFEDIGRFILGRKPEAENV